tara:strand:+ start:1377 stop:1712 length:336 start_codon:yes stop_codon:yes gene_type:complete
MSMSMRFNLNKQQRRLNQINNFYGSHKGWCRGAAMSHTHGASNRATSFYANSRATKVKKVYFRSFRNKTLCRMFMSKLNKRYTKRFNIPLKFRINLRGTKLEYCKGEQYAS